MEITELETPAVLIEEPILRNNIEKMQKFATELGFDLYPHFKTHKSVKIAEMQILNGAKGFTVSSLSEAEPLLNNGINDIIIAYPVVDQKIQKLFEAFLRSGKKIMCITDDPSVAMSISKKFAGENETIDVFIKVDVGLHRCGVLPFSDSATYLAKTIVEAPGIKLKGLLSHAGHAYSAVSVQQIKGIADQELKSLTNFAKELEPITGKIEWLSVGATPTAMFYQSSEYPMMFRPGNYVFNDMIQVSLGIASLEDCAMSILCTVISKPAENRLIIDAGKKTFSEDEGPKTTEKMHGYGGVLKSLYRKQLEKDLLLERLSEEHGIVTVKTRTNLKIGDKVRIIPNHACIVTNLHDHFYLTQGEQMLSKIKIDARGKSV
ncbi:MAG: hypothetical protein A2161_20190 [Candidatus Schekmanbacteria bacterium RBG_13_48_7]|uniref:D-serine dehydratase-like domain-containing protein n=1 Tax=Candidatus Schekmanbacteria bacterium RBG_13_48_7 TaxID=1817878 RepID=A0A1F7RZS0_9BACT|nr:MAG: hypothetical protein A2161_20190 [Candidatus Schekmanbacteria bacterium RBG_13_48_7]